MDTTGLPALLEPIGRDENPVLSNLFELYAHDFSEFVPLDLKANGRFDIRISEHWWTRDDHFPFFLRWGGKLSGFALVRRGSRITGEREVMDMAEFFVVRGARGKGVGTSAAHALFAAFPGVWEIRVRPANVPAAKFWSRAVEAWAGRTVAGARASSEGVLWDVLRVDTASSGAESGR
jgi:predicted acetyltransferase